jgi:hypothetical protein
VLVETLIGAAGALAIVAFVLASMRHSYRS